MKFILNTNTIYCFIMSLVFVLFPFVVHDSKPSEDIAKDIATAILPLCRMLGFSLAAMGFLSLISVRFLNNRPSVLTALFTLTIFHGGLLLTSGLLRCRELYCRQCLYRMGFCFWLLYICCIPTSKRRCVILSD